MSRRAWWVAGFLAATALAVGGELLAAFDSSPSTVPWTELVVRYIPWPVTATLIAVLVIWLPLHFWQWYHKRKDLP
jgi:membrane protein implicated in regulation of membrane protease activity